MKKFLLDFTILISGAVVMIFELVGSRLLAPFLGTSLPVWTSLIGVILGSLSIGYYIGGRTADKNPRQGVLSLLLIAAAFLISFTAITKTIVLGATYYYVRDIRIASILASIALFSPASIILGMVTPYAIRLRLNSLETSGRTIGALYAISTIGSIIGTFTAGFFLIPWLGSTKILFLLASLLAVSAIALNPREMMRFKKSHIVLIFFLALLYVMGFVQRSLAKPRFNDIETTYNNLRLFETVDSKTNRPVRCMSTDPHGTQGAMFLDEDNDLVFEYLKYYRLAEHFFPNFKNGLFIGGGVYAFPKDFIKRNPLATLEVVEIDPGVTEMARKYFNLRDNERMKIIHEDGRTFLNNTEKKYDVIYLDAFNAHITVPFQLTTREAVKKMHDSLSEDGVLMTNIISSLEGDKGKFLRAEIATYKEHFNQVYVFLINPDQDGQQFGNIMLVALKSKKSPLLVSDNDEFTKYLSTLWKKAIPADMPVLIDDYAPVDKYTMEFLKK